MPQNFRIAVERNKSVRGICNKSWTVYLGGEVVGMVELCRVTKDHVAIHYTPDRKRAIVADVRFPGTPEGMAAAVGHVVAANPGSSRAVA